MDNNGKPSFTANVKSPEELAAVAEARKTRPEVGAAWKRQSKSKNLEFLSLRLKLSKARLQQLLSTSVGDEVLLNLVAFPNKNEDGNPKRPVYRFYEELN